LTPKPVVPQTPGNATRTGGRIASFDKPQHNQQSHENQPFTQILPTHRGGYAGYRNCLRNLRPARPSRLHRNAGASRVQRRRDRKRTDRSDRAKIPICRGGVANINPKGATLGTGPFDFPVNFYESSAPFSGPTNFGSGDFTFANSGSGDFLGIQSSPDGFGSLLVPTGYVSGNALSDSATYNNKTLKRLGATPGTYEWTWGTGANQNFTLDIVAPGVPDSGSTLGLLFVSVIALFGLNRLRRVQLA